MEYNKYNLDKIANFFEKKIKDEGREVYDSFIKENNILEFLYGILFSLLPP